MKTNRWNWTCRSDRASEGGQTTVFFVLALGVFLLGALALAFDLSNMWFHRQAAQTAADAACAAGAMDLLVDDEGGATGKQGFTPGTPYNCTTSSSDSVCLYAAKNGYNSNNKAPGNLVSVSFPAGVSGVATPPASVAPTPFIRVDIVDNVQTFFLGLFGAGSSATVRSFSTCGVKLAQSPIPLVVLDPRAADSKTFSVSGSPAVSIYGGPQQSIQVDSPNVNSVNIGGTACVDLSQGGPALPPTGSDFGTWGGPATQTSTSCTSSGGAGFNPGTTGHWIAPNPPLNDPFAQVPAPAVPTYTPPNAPLNPAFTLTPGSDPDCPVVTGLDGCDVWEPGYYSSVLQLKGAGGTHVRISLFEPGIYYIATGGLQGASNSCIRPSSQIGDGSGGVMFYFADSSSVNMGSNSGKDCPAGDPFQTKTGTGYIPNGAKCTATSTIPAICRIL
jgi:Flp pilus assembly protein TadG